jgi:hypothetical protein
MWPSTSQEIDLRDLKVQMLGTHQLRNDVMSTCAALCLHNQGNHMPEQNLLFRVTSNLVLL